MSSKAIKYWASFRLILSIDRVRFAQLENYFVDLKNSWQATPADLRHASLDDGSIRTINSGQAKISLEAEIVRVEELL